MNLQDKNMIVDLVARGQEDKLVDRYISEGPKTLRESLKLTEEQWLDVFDYLVFEHNLLYKCVTRSADFFVDEYVKHGAAGLREILDIADSKYDRAFEIVFDFVAISKDGLYYHVIEHRNTYMAAMRARGGDFVRKVLCIWNDKYEETWARVLDFLLHAVCNGIFSEQTFEHGLRAFSKIMNRVRPQRALNKWGIL
ncbi:MAG: hypothetical protein ABIH78_02380 [Candidatus Peregrinibacteria bacterium]